MKTLQFLIILFSFSICYAQSPKQSLPDSVYSQMMWIAKGEIVINDTLFKFDANTAYYIVVKITNNLTKETKEICTLYPYLEQAIILDSKVCSKGYDREYTFFSEKSLEIVGFYDYEYEQFHECTKTLNADSLYSEALNDYMAFANNYSGKCQIYIAHLLFNHGFMSFAGSLAGHLNVLDNRQKKDIINSFIKNH